ncbi:hypothetical protein EES43_02930 [Streptomyces sp. ADI96-02]|uniref:hypothetical protein n=1 Tax=unclassified Streptomyces TaxID=2593676 RepID=UPI000F553602|nr:hypothetical protein [Streptomyces sp. ADI96-02]RPK67629.1 hypothetical protein EES43_02930 [Streptomyces sp. ADI96-02]
MTLSSAIGPYGVVANAAASTAYSIVKDFNTKVEFTSEGRQAINAFPDVLKDAPVEEDLGRRDLYGVFYTHSRFQPIVRRLAPHHHHQLRHRDEVARAVNKSHSIFMVLPWRMSYSAVRLDSYQAQIGLDKRMNELYAEMDKIDLVAEEDTIAEKTALLASHRYGGAAAQRQLRDEIARSQRRVDTYQVNRNAAERMAAQVRRLRDAGSPVYMRNFTIDAVEQANGVKARASTGLKGSGKMLVSTEQVGLQTYLSVQFRWHEDNFFGHGYDWNGRIDIRCTDDGNPDAFQGEGKFWDRFLETRG